MSHWLVTGGAGFIGSHLVKALLAKGDEVRVLDDLSTGRKTRLPPEVLVQVGSILDDDLLKRCMSGAKGVFHLAAIVSVEECIRNLVSSHRVNLEGTLRVLDAARLAGALPVVYASSAAVYGNPGAAESCDEDMVPVPISPYGADKLAGEHHARAMFETHRIPSVGLRFFNVYGPGQDPSSPYAGVISRFAENVRQGRCHVVYGDGHQTRDFVHVSDVVAALIAAQDAIRATSGARVCNVCTARAVSLLDVARIIDLAVGTAATPIEHRPARSGDIRHSRGSASRMKALLGTRPLTRLEAGLAQLVKDDIQERPA